MCIRDRISSLIFISAGFFGVTIPTLMETFKVEEPVEQITDFQNITMCAPISRFDIKMEDIFKSTTPLAPKLNPKWTTNLQISSSSKEAKEFFSQGLFYLYAFNHAEADRSFKEAIRLDPECAMCHWGVALALGPNINMPCLLYTSPSPRDATLSRMPSSA